MMVIDTISFLEGSTNINKDQLDSGTRVWHTNYQNMLDKYVADNYSNALTTASKKVINSFMRKLDESKLYPINGRFNVTDKAIRRYQRISRLAGYELADCVGSYYATLDRFISEIVNSSL